MKKRLLGRMRAGAAGVLAIGLAWCGPALGATYTWDTSTDPGIQPGNGTWGTDSYWTQNGTTLGAWVANSDALFAGAGGSYTIGLNGTIGVGSTTLSNGVYVLNSGTLSVANLKSIFVRNATVTINSDISRVGALTFDNTAGLTVGGTISGATGSSITFSGVGGTSRVDGVIGTILQLVANDGLIILNGANTYANRTFIRGGVVRATQGVGLPNNSKLEFTGAGTGAASGKRRERSPDLSATQGATFPGRTTALLPEAAASRRTAVNLPYSWAAIRTR